MTYVLLISGAIVLVSFIAGMILGHMVDKDIYEESDIAYLKQLEKEN